MTPRKTNELGSSLSAPVPWKYIGPEANCEAKRTFARKTNVCGKKAGDSLPSLPRPPHREPCGHLAVNPCCCTGNLEAWESVGDIKPFHVLSLNALLASPPRLNQNAYCVVLRDADWSVDDSPRHVSRDLPENAPRIFDIKRD